MKTWCVTTALAFLPLAGQSLPDTTAGIAEVLLELSASVQQEQLHFEEEMLAIDEELNRINRALGKEPGNRGEFIRLLNSKINLLEQREQTEMFFGLELSKIRYKKGLDLIRLLYEKVLGLDHHFSTLQTYQDVMRLSNPNSYPEFQNARGVLEKRLRKENALKLPAILNSNPYLSTTFSLVASLIGGGETGEREKELDNISCILDFTARMNSELATVYYETEYLKQNNATLKEECIALFSDYVGVIGYHTALDVCRKEDDWEKVYELLGVYISSLEQQLKENPQSPRTIKQQINLEFAVDRLIDFIQKYNGFVAQGTKYYQKFEIILSNYPNEKECGTQLPVQFSNLKKDVRYSIDRFNEAYNIAELKGSKLKDLLYGFSD